MSYSVHLVMNVNIVKHLRTIRILHSSGITGFTCAPFFIKNRKNYVCGGETFESVTEIARMMICEAFQLIVFCILAKVINIMPNRVRNLVLTQA